MKMKRKQDLTCSAARIGKAPVILAVLTGLQMFVLLPLLAAEPGKVITDSGITAAVGTDFQHDMGVSEASIAVQTSQGIVTLSGSVDNILAKRLAVKIAESVRGVLGVIDQITLKPESRPDEDIRKDILMALLNDPATDSYKVSASVNDAVVTLTGTVGSMAESQLAQRIAEGVKGIKDIRNKLAINYMQKRTDAEITADIQEVLHWDVWTIGYPIQVAVKDGHVTLSGRVGSVVEKWRMDSDAWVNGALSVDDNGLKVDPLARDKMWRKRGKAAWSDNEIKKAVEASLRTDPRVSHYATKINVTMEDGVAILDGPVEDMKAKSAAGRDARDIVGVSLVDNKLSVRPAINLPADADAQKDLQAALHWDPFLAGFQIEAAVINHTAYLNGSVDSALQKAEAQEIASRTKGVLVVRNHLKFEPEAGFFFYDQPYYDFVTFVPPYDFERFGPPPPKSDGQIKKDIERALFWSPFVHRNDITVTVDNGAAKLTGTVGTWIGYNEADQDARKSGAEEVINQLKVR
jgi:osmotically-inducible protein OsmY